MAEAHFTSGKPLGGPNALERFLRLFSDVRAGEGLSALLLTLNVFLILTAYYIIKPVREALILAGGGAEVKSYAAAGYAILLLGAVPLYGKLADRLPRRRLINLVTLFFVGCLGVFYLLARTHLPLGVIFFLWVGIFNMMVIAQFWAFANDLYTIEEGSRLFPIIAFGASAGAVFGSFVTGRLIGPLGVYQLLLLAAGVLAFSLILTNMVDARERDRTEKDRPPADTTAEQPAAFTAEHALVTPDEPISKEGSFRLVFQSRYLLLIALLMLFLNWVNTTGEYILGRTVAEAAHAAATSGQAGGLSEVQYIGRFYSDFFSVVNLSGLLLQLFVVSRILKYLGVRAAMLFLPAIALGGYAVLAFSPVLSIIRWAKTAENSTDYSLQNTVRQVLFLPTSREDKYKAKQAIDSFFVRAGDVLSAVVVYVGTAGLHLGPRHFALVNLALTGVWITLAVLIGREYRRLTEGRGRSPCPAAPGD